MTERRSELTGRVDDRGVSEVVAFILVFAIILGSVGLLYSTAFGAMTDYQETEQERNAVRAMDALADNFNELLRSNGVNERSGELSLREGTVSTGGGGTKVNVTIGKGGNETLGIGDDDRFAGYGDGVTAELGEFAYSSNDAEVAYEGGGLVRGAESGSVVLRHPQLRCDPARKTAVISLAAISTDEWSISSSSGQEFTMSVRNRDSAVYTGVDNVTVSVDDDTAYEGAWKDVLSEDRNWSGDDLAGTCGDFDGDGRVVVTIVEVGINDD